MGGIGAAALAVPVASGCSVLGRIGSHTLDFDTDFGVLNYAFTLETMEADFYNRVVANPPRDLLSPGAGVRIPLTGLFELRADARDVVVFGSGLQGGGERTTHNPEFTAGLNLRF